MRLAIEVNMGSVGVFVVALLLGLYATYELLPGLPAGKVKIIYRARPIPFPRSPLALVVVGLGSEMIYLLYFVGQFPLLQYYTTSTTMQAIANGSPGGFAIFLALSTLLFLLCAVACWQGCRTTDRAIFWIALGFGALFGITMAFVYPITANDAFAYVNQSRVLVLHHDNPIFMPAASYPNDPFVGLAGQWAASGSPYGPLGILVDALPTVVTGNNFLANLIVLKLMFVGITLICAVLVYHVLKRMGHKFALLGLVLVAWNPLLLIEIAANGHNDAAMMLLVMLGLLLCGRNKLLLGLVAVVASALVKYATAPLIPLFLIYGVAHQPTLRRRVAFVALSVVCSFVFAAALYLPFWHGPDTFTRSLQEDQFHIESFDSVVGPLFAHWLTFDQATLLGRGLFAVAYLVALWLSTRRLADLALGCFLSLFFFVALGAGNVKIWYAVWPAVLAAVTPQLFARVPALLLAWGATLSAAFYAYIWPWIGADGFMTANYASYAISFVPAVLVLLVLLLLRVRRRFRVANRRIAPTYSTPTPETG